MSGPGLRSALLAHPPDVPHGFEPRADEAPACRRPRQVHGARIAPAPEPGRAPEADGLVSTDPAVAVGVVTADCCPLLLADEEGRLVAAVHAGWRGIAAGVVEAAVTALTAAGARPDRLRAALGPSAGGCCYEVGRPVRAALGLDDVPAERSRIDLRAVVAARLARAGVPRERIERVGPCTICSAGWPSYRREGERAGRAVAWIRPHGGYLG